MSDLNFIIDKTKELCRIKDEIDRLKDTNDIIGLVEKRNYYSNLKYAVLLCKGFNSNTYNILSLCDDVCFICDQELNKIGQKVLYDTLMGKVRDAFFDSLKNK